MREFLKKYNTVIFDMDGVITSEQKYWDAAALTVWEYLRVCRGEHIDATECMARLGDIRNQIFCNDNLIRVLKNKGVNSNWDLGYVTVLMAWILKTENFEEIMEYAKTLPDNILDGYIFLAKECSRVTGIPEDELQRNARVWNEMAIIFQEWYVGQELWPEEIVHKGKTGLMSAEEPIVPKDELVKTIRALSKTHRLCTASGRPYIEMARPMTDWDILKYFDQNGLSNGDCIAEAESRYGITVAKPHPYIFLKALYGLDYDDKKVIDGDYDKSKITKALVVGDAGADILAARAMGADFCAVLTGVAGESAREYFEELNAEYILNSVLDLD